MLRGANEDLRVSSSHHDHERHQALRRLFLHVCPLARKRCDEIYGEVISSHLGNAECCDHFRAILLRKSSHRRPGSSVGSQNSLFPQQATSVFPLTQNSLLPYRDT